MSSMISACHGSMSPQKLNPVEPPWYGPVCLVVWEGRRCEASPYPDHRPKTEFSLRPRRPTGHSLAKPGMCLALSWRDITYEPENGKLRIPAAAAPEAVSHGFVGIAEEV